MSLVFYDRFSKYSVKHCSSKVDFYDVRNREILSNIHDAVTNHQHGSDRAFDDLKSLLDNINATLQNQGGGNTQSLRSSNVERADIIESLKFPAMFRRRDEIRIAHSDTYQWIFDSGFGRWDNFGEWLEGSGTLYWVHGKVGSGKSTLIKFLSDHPELKKRLSKWAQDNELKILVHFFWHTGTSEQKSLVGLLRSILYQIVSTNPELVDIILPTFKDGGSSWTIRSLSNALRHLISHEQNGVYYFFLIDGLDEFSADSAAQAEWISLVKYMSQLPRVKLCVSSRPEVHLQDTFGGHPQLRLQDFTWKDIFNYTEGTLRSLPRFHTLGNVEPSATNRLIENICRSAEGVFLWVHLAVEDIVLGVKNHDTIQMLHERLTLLGNSLDSLYLAFMNRIHPVHRQKAAELLAFRMDYDDNLIRTGLDYPVSTIHAGVGLDSSISSACSKLALCATDTAGGQDGQDAGSLFMAFSEFARVLHLRSSGFLETWQEGRTRCTAESVEYCTCIFDREVASESSLAKVAKHFDNQMVDFIHRSAYDFLKSSPKAKEFIKQHTRYSDVAKPEWWISVFQQTSMLLARGMLEHASCCFDSLGKDRRILEAAGQVQARSLNTWTLWNRFEFHPGYVIDYAFTNHQDCTCHSIIAKFFEVMEAFQRKAAPLFHRLVSAMEILDDVVPDMRVAKITGWESESFISPDARENEIRESFWLFARSICADSISGLTSSSRTDLVSWCLLSDFRTRRIGDAICAGLLVDRIKSNVSLKTCLEPFFQNVRRGGHASYYELWMKLLKGLVEYLHRIPSSEQTLCRAAITDMLSIGLDDGQIQTTMHFVREVTISDTENISFEVTVNPHFIVDQLWEESRDFISTLTEILERRQTPRYAQLCLRTSTADRLDPLEEYYDLTQDLNQQFIPLVADMMSWPAIQGHVAESIRHLLSNLALPLNSAALRRLLNDSAT